MTSISSTHSNFNNKPVENTNHPKTTTEVLQKTEELLKNILTSPEPTKDQKKITDKIGYIHYLNKNLLSAQKQSTLSKIADIAFLLIVTGALVFAGITAWPISAALGVFVFSTAALYGGVTIHEALKPQILQYRLDRKKEQLTELALSDPEKATFIKKNLTEKVTELESNLAQDFSTLQKPLNRAPYRDAIEKIRQWEVASGEQSLPLYQGLLNQITETKTN